MKKFSILLHLSCIKHTVLSTIMKIDDSKKLDVKLFYPTNADAVETIQIQMSEPKETVTVDL